MRDSAWGFPIIDFHCHFPVPDPAPPSAEVTYRWQHGERKLAELKENWRWYQEQWWDAYSFPYPEEPEPSAEVQARRWSAAKPVLTIHSGDTVEIQTVSGNPDRLEQSGLPPGQIPVALRTLFKEIPQDQRGPGAHLLTGPPSRVAS